MESLNIFTCCNGQYNQFIPLFVFSHLYDNNNTFVEVGYDDIIDEEIQNSINYLHNLYPGRFLIRQQLVGQINYMESFVKCAPNLTRFIFEPSVKSKYVYISDIDIICLEDNILKIHTDDMEKTGLPYSNIVREKSSPDQIYRRLTGLHFTPWKNYYPIPSFADLIENGDHHHDEVFLYEIVKKRYPYFNYENKFRPVHGIHISMNRDPDGWGIKSRKEKWIEFRNSFEFLEFEKGVTEFIKERVLQIDNFI